MFQNAFSVHISASLLETIGKKTKNDAAFEGKTS